ncbi:hypothetical protein HN011_009061 [Eciton burchellii]|nr:hypothetical protein HN011_009061 [Eciton burchellii]
MVARRSDRGVKRICIDIWATVSRFPMKSLGPIRLMTIHRHHKLFGSTAAALDRANNANGSGQLRFARDIFANEEIPRDRGLNVFGARSSS